MADPSLLVVGLGNPEPRYRDNRHNLGFQVLDALAGKHAGEWARKFEGELAQVSFGGTMVKLLKPLTFMNRSGDSVGPATRFFKLPVEQVVVVHDELDLPFGRVQLKVGGGHGGHNGLRSIEAALGGREYGRVRLGIGRPPPGWDVADFVLSNFGPEDVAAAAQEVTEAVRAVEQIASDGMLMAMNKQNRRSKV